MAYECLAGSPPFSGGALDVAIAHRDRPLPPLPASVPAEVVAFVMTLTAKDPAWRPDSAGEVAHQAGRLRDALLPDADGVQPVRAARPAGAPLTVPDDLAGAAVSSRPRVRGPRHRRALAVAALALAALTCLVLVSVTGFASGSHPASPPSPARSQAASAPLASQPAGQPSSASQPAGQPSSDRPAVSTGSPGPPQDASSIPPGQHHHGKGHGHGQGNGDGHSQ